MDEVANFLLFRTASKIVASEVETLIALVRDNLSTTNAARSTVIVGFKPTCGRALDMQCDGQKKQYYEELVIHLLRLTHLVYESPDTEIPVPNLPQDLVDEIFNCYGCGGTGILPEADPNKVLASLMNRIKRTRDKDADLDLANMRHLRKKNISLETLEERMAAIVKIVSSITGHDCDPEQFQIFSLAGCSILIKPDDEIKEMLKYHSACLNQISSKAEVEDMVYSKFPRVIRRLRQDTGMPYSLKVRFEIERFEKLPNAKPTPLRNGFKPNNMTKFTFKRGCTYYDFILPLMFFAAGASGEMRWQQMGVNHDSV